MVVAREEQRGQLARIEREMAKSASTERYWMPNTLLVHDNRLVTSAGSVIQSRYWTRLPSRITNFVGPSAILPTRAGGAGGRFFSVRRSGVAGSGNGGNDSPPVRLCGVACGGGPQSTGPLSS